MYSDPFADRTHRGNESIDETVVFYTAADTPDALQEGPGQAQRISHHIDDARLAVLPSFAPGSPSFPVPTHLLPFPVPTQPLFCDPGPPPYWAPIGNSQVPGHASIALGGAAFRANPHPPPPLVPLNWAAVHWPPAHALDVEQVTPLTPALHTTVTGTATNMPGPSAYTGYGPARRVIHYCPECQKAFTRKGNMRQHWTTKHSPTASKYQCLHCARGYTRKNNLTRHVKRVHADTI